MPDMAAVMPVQLAAPPLVHRQGGLRIAIWSCQAPTMSRRSGGAVGSTARVDDRGHRRHGVGLQQLGGVAHRPPPAAQVLAIIALSPRIGV